MADRLKLYVVFFKDAALGTQTVLASSCRIEGEHLIFLTGDGELAALFLLEIVMCWTTTHIAIA